MHKCAFSEEVSVCELDRNKSAIHAPSLLRLPHSTLFLLPNVSPSGFIFILCISFNLVFYPPTSFFFISSLESLCLVHLEGCPPPLPLPV